MDVISYILKVKDVMDKEDFALLKVIASNIETIKEELREMRESIKVKADARELTELKDRVTNVEERSESLHSKWWFASGIASAVSFIISHFFK